MNLFVFALLAVGAIKLGGFLAKIAVRWYESQRFKKFQNDFKTYIDKNNEEYEQNRKGDKGTGKDSGKV